MTAAAAAKAAAAAAAPKKKKSAKGGSKPEEGLFSGDGTGRWGCSVCMHACACWFARVRACLQVHVCRSASACAHAGVCACACVFCFPERTFTFHICGFPRCGVVILHLLAHTTPRSSSYLGLNSVPAGSAQSLLGNQPIHQANTPSPLIGIHAAVPLNLTHLQESSRSEGKCKGGRGCWQGCRAALQQAQRPHRLQQGTAEQNKARWRGQEVIQV